MMAYGAAGRRDDLPTLERTVLWCIRAWVISLSDRPRYAEKIETIFTRLGVGEAIPDLHGLMMTLARGARRTIDVNCVCFPDISADERCLLDALALQQREEHEDAFEVLTGLMTETATMDACDYLARLAFTFTAAGHLFGRPRTAPLFPAGDAEWSSSIPAATVH